MTGDAVRPEPHFVEGVVECLRCGNGVLEAVSDGEETRFLCHTCWTCWSWELGFVSPVLPDTCPGCPHRTECLLRRRQEDAGRWPAATTALPTGP